MIALFTDFGTRDAYVAQLKGAILSLAPHTSLIDLNHEVGQFDRHQATYLLDASARYFPAGTIFVAVVDPGVGTSRQPVLVHTQADKWYVGPDNGIFTRVVDREGLQDAYVLRQTAYFRSRVSTTFHGRDIFGPVAAHLARGVAPAQFGPRITTLERLPFPAPQVAADHVTGEVVHIDHYGNIITNLTAGLLADLRPHHSISCTLNGCIYILPCHPTYGAGTPGQLMCLFNSNDEFEIALPQGQAASQVQAQVGQRLVLHRQAPERGV